MGRSGALLAPHLPKVPTHPPSRPTALTQLFAPPLLQLSLLNVPPALDAIAALPRPQHVILNHIYLQRLTSSVNATVLGTTHRYRSKWVGGVGWEGGTWAAPDVVGGGEGAHLCVCAWQEGNKRASQCDGRERSWRHSARSSLVCHATLLLAA